MRDQTLTIIVIVCLSVFLLISAWKDNSVLDVIFKPIHRSKCAAGSTESRVFDTWQYQPMNVADLGKIIFFGQVLQYLETYQKA